MNFSIRRSVGLLIILLLPQLSSAFHKDALLFGIGFYSQNISAKVAQAEDGSSGTFGESNYPLLLQLDYAIGTSWYLSPQIGYTPVPRYSAGNSAQTTLAHVVFRLGQNVQGTNLDWYVGPGLIDYEVKGAGGTTVLNNGTGTTTFAVPGRNVSIRKVTTNFGLSHSLGPTRIALDLIFENVASASKRTQSLMFSLCYQFRGGR